MVKFLRRTWSRYVKLGKGRKKKQVWRSPKGRDNKMREKRKGYPAVVSIGYSSDKKIKDRVKEKIPILVSNIKDLEKIKKNNIAIITSVGKKKKIEILKKAQEKKIIVSNVNIKRFLKKIEIQKKAKEDKIEKEKSEKAKNKIKKDENIKENSQEKSKENKK
ncbi:MAG: eL32 family ribosomal protein [archaeon]